MKPKAHFLLLMIAAFTLTLSSCRKDRDMDMVAEELSAHSDDQSRLAGDVDDVANDANAALEDYSSFNGRVDNVLGAICGATTVIDSTSNPKKITITYNGLNCAGTRNRVGVVVLSMPQNVKWKDAGAVLTISIQNLKVTRVRDNKSITINGTKTITNITGGRLRDLANNGNITHHIESNGLTITFDNNTQRSWRVAKKRVFTYNNGLVITTTGLQTEGGITGVSEWGTNRLGNAFITAISQPMVIRQDCAFRVVSGQVTHNRLAANGVVTFGLDSAGNPTSCPGAGTYYLKLVCTGMNGGVRTVILPY